MPKQREPVDLIVAKKRKHFTKKDIEERRAKEVNVPFKNVVAPKYLNKQQKKEFYDIAYKLLEIGVMTELDEDALARYLLVKDEFLVYSKSIRDLLEVGEVGDAIVLGNQKDKLFKQVRAAAADLGLTITSRCKLVIPQGNNDDVEL